MEAPFGVFPASVLRLLHLVLQKVRFLSNAWHPPWTWHHSFLPAAERRLARNRPLANTGAHARASSSKPSSGDGDTSVSSNVSSVTTNTSSDTSLDVSSGTAQSGILGLGAPGAANGGQAGGAQEHGPLGERTTNALAHGASPTRTAVRRPNDRQYGHRLPRKCPWGTAYQPSTKYQKDHLKTHGNTLRLRERDSRGSQSDRDLLYDGNGNTVPYPPRVQFTIQECFHGQW